MFSLFCRAAVAIRRTSLPIVELIEADPGGFEIDHHYATHKGAGLRVWVANEAYGLGYETYTGSDDKLQKSSPAELRIFGSWSEKIQPSAAERKLIWAAFKSMVEARKRAAERKMHADLVARIDRVLTARSAA